MNKFYSLYIFLCLCVISGSFAQNEFYNNSSIVYINGRVNTSVPTLKVNGTLTNNNGSLTNNAGLIEVAGDWLNTSSSYYYVSTGIERFTGTSNQTISGNWSGTSGNQNQFYDLKINKTQTSGQIISLTSNVHVNAAGSLAFESSNGIIRTDNSGHADDGSAYPYYIYLQNPDPTKLTGNSWTAVTAFNNDGGATTKYIEGKLKLAVSSNNTYKFPIGVAPGSLDGMEGVSVKFNGTFTTTGLLAYIQPVPAGRASFTSDLITNGQILFYDIGSLPAAAPYNQFNNCVGTQDGHDDVAVIDNAIPYEWILTPDAAPSTTFDLSLHPGPNLDNISWVQMGAACNSIYKKTKYTANAGIIGGDEAVGPTYNFDVPGVLGLYQKPNGNQLTSQTTFSRFRIFGTSYEYNTSLPIELKELKAEAINNEFIKVSWSTASEYNNKGFVLLRSTNGIDFDSIAWIGGNGTTNNPHAYLFDDYNVQKGIVYYYRLKEMDYFGSFTFSPVVSAKLIFTNIESIHLYPNPTSGNTTLQIISAVDDVYALEVFNAIGQNMLSKQVLVKSGIINNTNLSSVDWAKGMYIVKVQSQLKKEIRGIRFIKE
ncbi:MAG: T9SS type A sorting domain-containing protein [Chitinophagales bacterium]